MSFFLQLRSSQAFCIIIILKYFPFPIILILGILPKFLSLTYLFLFLFLLLLLTLVLFLFLSFSLFSSPYLGILTLSSPINLVFMIIPSVSSSLNFFPISIFLFLHPSQFHVNNLRFIIYLFISYYLFFFFIPFPVYFVILIIILFFFLISLSSIFFLIPKKVTPSSAIISFTFITANFYNRLLLTLCSFLQLTHFFVTCSMKSFSTD